MRYTPWRKYVAAYSHFRNMRLGRRHCLPTMRRNIMAESTELVVSNGSLAVAPVSSLPTIAEVRQRMAWMTEFRPALLDFVRHHMDPARHMYSFQDNRYSPL